MKKVKELLKNIILILAIILIFKTITSYQLAKSEFITYDYTVENGDTLWSIALDICENNNELYIKNVINNIKEANSMSESTIYNGQVIKLPIYN